MKIVQNEYLCWISGLRCDTEETIVAESSLEARKVIANKHRMHSSEAVAHRLCPKVTP